MRLSLFPKDRRKCWENIELFAGKAPKANLYARNALINIGLNSCANFCKGEGLTIRHILEIRSIYQQLPNFRVGVDVSRGFVGGSNFLCVENVFII